MTVRLRGTFIILESSNQKYFFIMEYSLIEIELFLSEQLENEVKVHFLSHFTLRILDVTSIELYSNFSIPK